MVCHRVQLNPEWVVNQMCWTFHECRQLYTLDGTCRAICGLLWLVADAFMCGVTCLVVAPSACVVLVGMYQYNHILILKAALPSGVFPLLSSSSGTDHAVINGCSQCGDLQWICLCFAPFQARLGDLGKTHHLELLPCVSVLT